MNLIVLDTNVLSELMRPEPDERVVSWIRAQRPDRVRTTAIAVAEIRFGLGRLPAGRRRDALTEAADAVLDAFAESVLAFDLAAADEYGIVATEREQAGRPISGFDAQIAAICLARGAALATRNTADFRDLGLDLVDPWVAGTLAHE